jgi:glucose-1-phosphate cytidylyltransferase
MKVVLFCGGQGTRLRDYSEKIPKPLVPVDGRPILWHIMRYYAFFGHKDFIICLGYKGEAIKNFFLNYNECLTNDFVLNNAEAKVEVLDHDVRDWRITFVDTGQNTNIGGRLLRVKRYLKDEEIFLVNYSDTLTDLNLNEMISQFSKTGAVAGFCCVKPPYSYHLVSLGDQGSVAEISQINQSGLWMNGGYMVLRKEIFEKFSEGEELVVEGFQRLIGEQRLYAHQYEGFWTCMDTFKEKQTLDDMVQEGNTPWQVWKAASQ